MKLKTCSFPILVLFLVSITFIKSTNQTCLPQQIHLSLGDKYHSVSEASVDASSLSENQAYLVWLAKDHCKFSVNVTEAKDLKMNKLSAPTIITESYSHDFAEDLDGEFPGSYQKTSYTALLQNLLHDTLYQYKILDSDGQLLAGPFNFSLANSQITTKSRKIIFFGNVNNSTSGNATIQELHSKLLKTPEDYAALVHLGSNFYQIQDANGTKGDQFFESIENLTRTLPLVSSPGVNDSFDSWNFFNFRTRNPLYKQTQNQYFSFNLEGIHFLNINFDFSFTNESTQQTTFSWVEKNLIQANDPKNRALYPWIVVIAQKPIYCNQNTPDLSEENKCYSQYNKMKNWDELFHKYSVDLMISGGPNSYERMSPIYQNKSSKYTENPNDSKKVNIKDSNGTVYIVENVAATKEGENNQYKTQAYGYFIDQKPGFGALYSTKEETGEFKLVYEHYNSQNGQVIDTMNLIKTNILGKHKNKTPYLLMVLGMAFGVILVTIGLIALRRMKQNTEAEDNIPLTGNTNPNGNSPLRSNRLRYARPGEKGITMVDLVLC